MRRVILILAICTLFVHGVCIAAATGWDDSPVSDEEKGSVLEQLELQRVRDDGIKAGIQCFDVRQDGTVALGIGSGSGSVLYIYDASGVFRYGYRLCTDGAWGLEFQGDMLALYFLRGNTFVLFDSEGICVDVRKITDRDQTYGGVKELLNRTSRNVGDKTYVLERDMNIGDTYSRLVVTDKHGSRTVLYDVTAQHKTGQLILTGSVVCFFAVVIWGCIAKRKRASSSARNADPDTL